MMGDTASDVLDLHRLGARIVPPFHFSNFFLDALDRELYARQRTDRVNALRRVRTSGPAVLLRTMLRQTGYGEAWHSGVMLPRERLHFLHELRHYAKRWLRAESAAMRSSVGSIRVGGMSEPKQRSVIRYIGRMQDFLREALGVGYRAMTETARLSPEDSRLVDEEFLIYGDGLDLLARQIANGSVALDEALDTRISTYGDLVWSIVQEIIRDKIIAAGVATQERRVHIPADTPCPACQEEIDRGWVPLGQLNMISHPFCHCSFEYRRGPRGAVHRGGRGPLYPEILGQVA